MKEVYRNWKKIVEKISDLQIRIIFSTLYFILLTPYGLIVSYFRDYFKLKSFPKWEEVKNKEFSIKQMGKQ